MGLAAGAFNRRIEIWRDVQGAENDLGERPVTPTKVATLWAAKDYLSQAEKLAAAQVDAQQTVKFTVRYSLFAASIMVTDRVRFQGMDFNINNVAEFGFHEDVNLYVIGSQRSSLLPFNLNLASYINSQYLALMTDF